MTRNDAVKKVAEALRMIQEMSGRPADEIAEDTIPIGGLAGFDSLNGVEVAVIVGAISAGGLVNICVSEDGRRALSVGEIADSVLRLASKGKG
jgi:hypothetical protein